MSGKLFFVTGTDTDVGKTVASAQLIRGFVRAGFDAVGMKPAASGCIRSGDILINTDVELHRAASNIQAPAALCSPYLFEPAISPHIAAHEAGIDIDLQHLKNCAEQLTSIADRVIIEGAGGWFAPLSTQATIADLATELQAPVIMVVGMRLGCLNHAMLTAKAIKQQGLTLAGWIANPVDPLFSRYAENLAYLKQQLAAPLLAELSYTPEALNAAISPVAIAQLEQFKSPLDSI
ncbi:dethiobiotin synthase [Deefgea sp. CFH1-16]|uniref:dethiobiotin synthase n=1 Tax=Deefgea sp. CFH1-16 TaxID=2675457 RepID=UPI0015F5D08F|nr:dethiobiotin synthase [Deefgea sp. CFH1-16]MBM5575608.1 dethiobiotin synthase [Deefgea sp. CFH1-16]